MAMNEEQEQRTFLVTGATGFVGRQLVAALLERHDPARITAMAHTDRGPRDEQSFAWLKQQGVPILECDLLQLPQAGLKPPRFEVVYHLAAFAETETPGGPFRVNSEGTRHLIEWLGSGLRGRRFVYTGTLASVDRDRPVGPITETTPCTPKTAYGQTKLLGEECIRSRRAKFGFDYTILRLCTIIGPGFRPGGMFGRCPELLAANKLAARLNWPGRVSFLALNDLVRLLLAIPGEPRTANELFVLSNGENPTFDQLLELMAGVLGLQRHRLALPEWFWRLVGAASWPLARSTLTPDRLRNFCWRVAHITHDGLCADGAKLNNLLGNRHQSVLDALRETYGT